MITRDRPEMAARAARRFEVQTYDNKRLLIWDSSSDLEACVQLERGVIVRVPAAPKSTIGALRNAANQFWNENEILIHWDDDDWSHPRRIEEQVALLQASGTECVGYREMLFWDTRPGQFPAAWLYHHDDTRYVLGTSMCYWRSAWERHPFEDCNNEDFRWWITNAQNCRGESAMFLNHDATRPLQQCPVEPRMIATIHCSNTSRAYQKIAEGISRHRVPEWDEHCAKVMALPQ
jgi:glycosyltransferase involved in cell wall biosynthesis